jgi:hypothetical protein
MTQTPVQSQLYERDFSLWVADTIAKLKAQEFDKLDLDNLIEEIEALGKRDRRELKSRLRVLLSHLLKRCYVVSPEDFRGWELTIREQRTELQDLLEQSPSLNQYLLNEFDKVWLSALSQVIEDYPSIQFPDVCPFLGNVDALLSQRFWEKN